MQLFHKRPLSLCLCIILSAFSLFHFLSDDWAIVIILALCTVIAALFLVPALRTRSLTLLKCVLISLLISSLLSTLYFNVFFYPEKLYGNEYEIEAKITDIDHIRDNYSILSVRTSRVDGKASFRKLKVYVYGSLELDAGDRITFTEKILDFSTSESFDYKNYYSSLGFCGRINLSEITDKRDGTVPLSYRFKQMRQAISEYTASISDDDAEGLLSALLLGERDRLPDGAELDYKRLGITHILSLGGFHLAILIGGMNLLLYPIGKRGRLIVSLSITLLFMLFTGFPVTVARAGFMLILSTVLTLAAGMKDGVTSLFFASFVMLCIQPYSALDIGFWLSVLATLGIISAGGYFSKNYDDSKGIRRILRSLVSTFVFSLFAISSTSIVSSFSFDGISLLGIPATIVFSLLLNAYIYFGVLVLALGWLIPPLGALLSLFAKGLLTLSSKTSDIEGIFVSSDFSLVTALAFLLGISFALFVILRIKRKGVFISFMALTYTAMLIFASSASREVLFVNDATAYSDYGERIVIKTEGGETVMLDATGFTKDSAYDTVTKLTELHITDLSHYYFPVYPEKICEITEIVISRIKVRNIFLPAPEDENESVTLDELTELAKSYGVTVKTYIPLDTISVGKYSVTHIERSNDSMAYVVNLSDGKETVSFYSLGAMEECITAVYSLYTSDAVIFGSKGYEYKTVMAVDEYGESLRRVVLFDELPIFDTRIMGYSPKIVRYRNEVKVFEK